MRVEEGLSATYNTDLMSIKKDKNGKYDVLEEGNKVFSKRGRFEKLCKIFPDVAFCVDDRYSEKEVDQREYTGICDTRQFGYPGKVSILIPDKVIEKMGDPEYEERLVKQVDNIIYNYQSTTQGVLDGKMKYVAVQLRDMDESDGKHVMHSVFASEEKMKGYTGENDDPSDHKKWMERKNYNWEKMKNKMLDELFKEEKNE